MVRPDRKMLTYKIDFTKAIQTRRLTMGVADGIVEADGEVIYQVTGHESRAERKLRPEIRVGLAGRTNL